MTSEMVWQQQEDFSWECDVNRNLIYKIERPVEGEDTFIAWRGVRSYLGGGSVATSLHPVNFYSKETGAWSRITDKMSAALKACASDCAEHCTKHMVKSITETDADGHVKYLVSEFV